MRWLIVAIAVVAAAAVAGCQDVADGLCRVVACPLGGVHVDPPAGPAAEVKSTL